MKTTYDYEQEIRKLIKHNKIPTTIDGFRVLCSALDILGDTEVGLDEYLSLESENGRGINYIYISGAISLMASQINAVKAIYKILTGKELDIKQDSNLEVVRLLRNKIFAHPAEYKENSMQGYGVIAGSLSTFRFVPYTFTEKGYVLSNDNRSVLERIKNLVENQENDNYLFIDLKEVLNNMSLSLQKYLKEIIDLYEN